MHKTSRPEPFFIADNRALDFLNTTAAPWGKDIEWLETGPDLLNWLETTDMLPGHIAANYLLNASATDLDTIAEKARDLREWFRDYVSGAGRTVQPENGFVRLNQILAHGQTYLQITLQDSDEKTGDPVKPQLTALRHWHKPDDLLVPLAEIIADLICNTGFDRVKNCEGPTCTMWFNDISKNHKRRWCTMAVCGNRAKAAAFRAKQKASAE
jgi:predicted RNA-binding Zn ribbon-like protein